MADWIDDDGYRANVGIILSNSAHRVFLGQRLGNRGWQFPQGGIKPGEKVTDAMFRELEEETGLKSEHVEILAQTTDWLSYKLPKRFMRFGSKPLCIGQKQRWFLLRFVGHDEDVSVDASWEPEFEDWCWVDFWEPVKRVIYFKRPVYERALTELGPTLFPEGLPENPRKPVVKS